MSDNAALDDAEIPNEPVHIEDVNHFQEFLSDNDVVLVDFYADWCGPCKMLEPIVEDLAESTPAAVGKVDVDVHQQLAGQFGVRGVPTTVLFADGEAQERIVGVAGEQQYRQLIDQFA